MGIRAGPLPRRRGQLIHLRDERIERIVERELVAFAGGAHLALSDAAAESLGTHRDLDGHAEEVGVGELHPRADVTVVVEDVYPPRVQALVQDVGGSPDLGRVVAPTGQDHEVHLVRRDRRRATRCHGRRGAPR